MIAVRRLTYVSLSIAAIAACNRMEKDPQSASPAVTASGEVAG